MRSLLSFLLIFSVSPVHANVDVPLYRLVLDETILQQPSDIGPAFTTLTEYFILKNFTIGNPPQSFNLTISDAIFGATVLDDNYLSSTCEIRKAERKRFASSRSTTYRHVFDFTAAYLSDFAGIDQNNTCWDYDDVATGAYGSDDVTIGASFSAMDIPFFLLKTFDGAFDPSWSGDGIFGLNFPQLYNFNSSYFSAATMLAQAVGGAAYVTVHLKSQDDPSQVVEQAGTVTFGGKNTKDCSDYQYVSLTSDGDNFIGLYGFQVGNYINPSGQTGVLWGFNQQQLTLLSADFNATVKEIGATQLASGVYGVECSRVPTLPPITFTVVGENGFLFNYVIQAKDYIRNVLPRTDSYCVLQLQPDEDTIFIGSTALRSHCWLFDYEQNKLAFADAFPLPQ
jgi:hypothetical protein